MRTRNCNLSRRSHFQRLTPCELELVQIYLDHVREHGPLTVHGEKHRSNCETIQRQSLAEVEPAWIIQAWPEHDGCYESSKAIIAQAKCRLWGGAPLRKLSVAETRKAYEFVRKANRVGQYTVAGLEHKYIALTIERGHLAYVEPAWIIRPLAGAK